MQPPAIVGIEVRRELPLRLPAVTIRVQIDLLVLDRPPFCAVPQNGGFVPSAVTWPPASGAVDVRLALAK